MYFAPKIFRTIPSLKPTSPGQQRGRVPIDLVQVGNTVPEAISLRMYHSLKSSTITISPAFSMPAVLSTCLISITARRYLKTSTNILLSATGCRKDPQPQRAVNRLFITSIMAPRTNPFRVDGRSPRWWNQAFEAAGYINAFQVKLRGGCRSDGCSVQYDQLVHRSTRAGPTGLPWWIHRTGDNSKRYLGSLRVRQGLPHCGRPLSRLLSTDYLLTTKCWPWRWRDYASWPRFEVGHTGRCTISQPAYTTVLP